MCENAAAVWADRWGRCTYRDVPERLRDFVRPGDSAAAALWYVQETLDFTLTGRTRARVGWGPARGGPALYEEPADLATCLYLQLAKAIYLEKRQRKCAACGRWFEVASGGNRADRITCSAACRQKQWRLRGRAQALVAKGKTVEEVAEFLGYEPADVREWLSLAEEK
jgi:hypothetical protein